LKIIISIFLVYLLALQVIPCCAFDACADDEKSQVANADHADDDEESGSCSPFFQCGSCPAATMQTEFISYTYTPTFLCVNYAELPTASLHDVYRDYWKPPRVG
jgi:hypothetical protein